MTIDKDQAARTEMRIGLDLLQQVADRTGRDLEGARELYRQDRRFRVVREGARLEGIVTFGTGSQWAGWSRPLKVGEIITCEGWKPGMDTDQEGVNWSGRRVPDDALWVQVWPMESLWRPYPMKGFLEPIEEGEGE